MWSGGPVGEGEKTWRLQWFGHVKRRDEDNPVNVARNMEVPGRRPFGHPKMPWQKGIDKDLANLNIREEQAYHHKIWRSLIQYRGILINHV